MVIGWSLIRALLVWAVLGNYGLNPWMYLVVDLCAATIDAYATPKMVFDFVDDRFHQAAGWGLVALGAFLVPDLYIFLGSRTLPWSIVLTICLVISVTLTVGIVGVVRKVQTGRAARQLSGASASSA